MDEVLTIISSALGDGPMSEPWAWSDEELMRSLDLVYSLVQRASAAHLAIVREIEGRGLPKQQHYTAVRWLSERHRVSPTLASRMLSLAKALDGDLAATADALATGDINVEQAETIAQAVHDLPSQHHAEGERRLLEEASVAARPVLKRLGERLLPELDPDEAERREAEWLTQASERAHQRRGLTLTDIDGTQETRIRGVLERSDAALLRETLDSLTSPRRTPQPDDTPAVTPAPTPAAGPAATPAATPASNGHDSDGHDSDGHVGPDASQVAQRSPRQRRLDALIELCRMAQRSGQLPANGGDRPQVAVTVSLQTLQDRIGAATLDDGSRIDPEAARRLACDARVLPIVLGGPSQILDAGQERRLFTGPLRRALVLRDGGCTFPGCDRPPRWTEGHHIVHWADGGPTSLDNAALLCAPHHHVIHHGDWSIRLDPADGRPVFIPPPYVDREQKPRRNRYHRRQ